MSISLALAGGFAVGGAGRLGYTGHGDAVNRAARIEQMNKELATTPLVAGTTASLCGEEIDFTAVGVRGREQPVQLFASRSARNRSARIADASSSGRG